MNASEESRDITRLLQRAEAGEAQAADLILPLVYGELRKPAAARKARESAGQTLQPTALVHEAWLRLGGEAQPDWKNRAHFFAAAAEAMRRILIENIRRKRRIRHGGGCERAANEPGDGLYPSASGGPNSSSRKWRDCARSSGER